MQLKIQINVSQDPVSPLTSPPTPAPFDTIKIRNFLLLVITLLSLLGFGVYNLWFKGSEPTSHNTLNSPINAKLNTVTVQQPNNAETLVNTTLTKNTVTNKAIDTLSDLASDESPARNKRNTAADTTTETNRPKPQSEVETQTSINVTPQIVNNIEQKNAELLIPNKTINNVVQRAQITSNILSREPIDNIEYLNLQDKNKLYLFTEIHDSNNQKIVHRWMFNKELITQVTLNIGSNQWRTYSSKNFDETMVGSWTVEVVDEDDTVLKILAFEVLR